MKKEKEDFLEMHKGHIEYTGFWIESYYATVKKQLEMNYKTDVIRDFCICEIELGRKKVLIKWAKRLMPLSDEELLNDYGRDVKKQVANVDSIFHVLITLHKKGFKDNPNDDRHDISNGINSSLNSLILLESSLRTSGHTSL